MARWGSWAERATYWTVPKGVYEWLQAWWVAAPAPTSPEDRAIVAQARRFHNRHAGQRCFILACGPSIKRQDLKRLRGEHCIAMSNFFVHPDYRIIAPHYYCLGCFHPPMTEEGFQAWLKELEGAVGDATVFTFLSEQQRHQQLGCLQKCQVQYLDFGTGFEGLQFRGVDLTRRLPHPTSISIMALLIALYMGFKQIYLLGCDHDWILHMNQSTHFYEEHQHALNRLGYNEWHNTTAALNLRAMIGLWAQYEFVKQLARRHHAAEIYNATAGSLLDVFPQVVFESLFSGHAQPIASLALTPAE